jgi:hypothetical protein
MLSGIGPYPQPSVPMPGPPGPGLRQRTPRGYPGVRNGV